MKRSLIVLIPGLTRVTRSEQLSLFVNGMIAASERSPLQEVSDSEVPIGVKRLRCQKGEQEIQFDVVEAYWNDLVPSLTQESIKTKLVRGISLAWFWLTSSIWHGLFRRKYLTVGLLTSALSLIVWYASTVLLFLETLEPESIESWPAWGQFVITLINQWAPLLWVTMSVLVVAIPINILVDISDFAKRYITDEASVPGQPPVRFEIVRRVREQLMVGLEHEDYHSVTIVGHSFGAVVAVDLMADIPPLKVPVRVFTIGSLIEILGKQASWLVTDIENLKNREDLEEWVDINSQSDWFASGVGITTSGKIREVEVKSFATFIDKVYARVHSSYFDNQETVNLIVDRSTDSRD